MLVGWCLPTPAALVVVLWCWLGWFGDAWCRMCRFCVGGRVSAFAALLSALWFVFWLWLSLCGVCWCVLCCCVRCRVLVWGG